MLEVRLCGGVEIRRDGAVAPEALLAGRQGRLVFAYLVCERNRSVPREELADLLWPDQLPPSWANSLSVVISRLRRTLVDAALEAQIELTAPPGTYRLELSEDVVVDWDLALRGVAAAEAAVVEADGERALRDADEAAAILERGFLVDDCVWVDGQRDVARDFGARAAVARSEALWLQGSASRAIDAAREALVLDDTRESAFRALMRAHAAAGERAEALRVWERCRTMLVGELGVDPSPETEAVYLDILRGPVEPAAVPVGDETGELPSGVVTFLLTDIVESSTLWEQQPRAMAAALERHDALVTDVVTRSGGTLLKSKLEGDATVSVFTRATAGAAAAAALRDALAQQDWPDGAVPQVRMALHTGEAYERGGDYFGPALNRAARLRALAGPDQILLSQAAAELVRDRLPEDVVLLDRGHRDLRGLSRGENVYELAARSSLAAADYERADLLRPALPNALNGAGPFVGRDGELSALAKDWDLALGGAARGVLIGGEPGVGKSRLAAECARRAHAAGAFVLYGRCDEELGAPYQPFIDAVRALAPALGQRRLRDVRGVDELIRVVPEIAEFVPAAAPATRADPDTERYALFSAVTQLLVVASAQAPVMLVLDDLHWAGKTTLTLLRHILRDAGSARLLVVGTYRDTELSRTHPLAATIADLRSDGVANRLPVGGLMADDVVEYLFAVGNEDRALGRELAKVTAGNAFFLIEALRHVVESGGTWQPGSLPEGVKEATGRRLSRLSDGATAALSVAAVVGSTFALDIVEAVRGCDLVDELDEARRAGLVIEEPGAGGTFRFAHAIVRQVLLAELVTVRRVRMHRTIAELLEARAGDAPDAYLTDLAHHWFECASAGAADKAVAACRRAAEHAIGELAFEEAADLFNMALAAMESADEPDPDTVAALHLSRCDALLTAGEVVAARAALEDLAQVRGPSRRLRAWHMAFSGQLAVLSEPERLVEVVDGVGAAAQTMRELGDLVGEAKARYVHALALERLGRIGESERALDAALAAAREAGNRSLADAVLAEVPLAVLWGPSPVTRASGRCLDVVRVCRITAGAAAVESVALRCQAVLEALRGRGDAARRMISSARRTAERLGLSYQRLETEVAAGMIELFARDWERAEEVLRPAWDELRERRLGGEAARAGGLLGRALLQQHRTEEAEAVAEEAAQLAGADLRASIVWRGVVAEAMARRGDFEGALTLVRAAVEIAAPTDALLSVADARLALASVLRMTGQDAEADAEARRALEACEAKGATVLADIARTVANLRPDETEATEAPAASQVASPIDPEQTTAATRVVGAVHAMNTMDPQALDAYLAPNMEIDDRRSLVGGDRTGGQLTVDLLAASGGELGLEVLATRGDRLVLTCFLYVLDGAELELLAVSRCRLDGKFDRQVWFDLDDIELAYAELDALYDDSSDEPFTNTVITLVNGFVEAWNRGDWNGVEHAFGVDANTSIADDRAFGQEGAVDALEQLRFIWETTNTRVTREAFLTRGADLALYRMTYHIDGAGNSGTSEMPILGLVQLHDGVQVPNAMFDAHDFERGYEELNRRYLETLAEGPRAVFTQVLASIDVVTSGDFEAIEALTADDFHFDERRPLLGELPNPREVWLNFWREVVTNAPDAKMTLTHVLGIEVRTALLAWEMTGTYRGVTYERSGIGVFELNASNQLCRVDNYELEQIEDARANFAASHPAVKTWLAIVDGWNARDWDQVIAHVAPDIDGRDARRFTQVDEYDFLADLRAMFDLSESTIRHPVVEATAGDRSALVRITFVFEDHAAGVAEVDALGVFEINDEAQWSRMAIFDVADLDAALSELKGTASAGT